MGALNSAFRRLAGNPLYALLAVCTLALGIGANTAIFSAVHGALMRSLPYAEAERLVRVYETVPSGRRNTVSGGAFKDWQAEAGAFEALATWEHVRLGFSAGERVQAVPGIDATADYLTVLGIRPALGRGFAAGDDAAQADHRRLLLSHGLWQELFGGDPGVIGRSVAVDREPHIVVGVLPQGAPLDGGARFLRPLLIDGNPEAWARAGHWRHVIGKLAPGVTPAMAQTELRAIRARLAELYPAFKQDWGVAVLPLREALSGGLRPLMLTLSVTAGLVLLIACVNLASLMLLCALSRSRELALRSALGAARPALLRDSLAEALLLALGGALCGLALAVLGSRWLASLSAGFVPDTLAPALSAEVLLLALAVSLLCGLAAGALPALRASRADPATAIGEGDRDTGSRASSRARSALLAAQTAFTVVLLVGAGLMLRSFVALLDTDPGFQPEHTFAFDLQFPSAAYPDQASRDALVDALLQRLQQAPGVQAAAASTSLPLSRGGISELAGRAGEPLDPGYVAGVEHVSGDLLGALGAPLLRGRALGAADRGAAAERVALINQRIADDLFPGEDPLDRMLNVADQTWRIVGVVGDLHHRALHLPPPPMVYTAQHGSPFGSSVLLRGTISAEAMAALAREGLAELDPEMPMVRPRSLVEDVHRDLQVQRTLLQLLSLFAALALLLAAVGTYGAMAFSVGQRRRELGVRAALGAGRGSLLRMVLTGGLRPCLLGTAIGILIALPLGRGLQSQLHGIDGHDPWAIAGAAGLMLLVALLALLPSGRRAAATPPAEVLRGQ